MDFLEWEKPAKITKKGEELIEKAKNLIINTDKSNPNRDRIIEEAMNEMYDYFSKYSEDDLNNLKLQYKIVLVERLLENEFLPLQSEPVFDENFNCKLPDTISNSTDAEKYLDFVVHQTRKKISKNNDIKNASMSKQCINTSCFNTSRFLEKVCEDIGLDAVHFGVNQELNYGMFHNFTIVNIPLTDGTIKHYLMDCTYRQFFTKADNNLKRISAMRGPASGCSIGSYMMMDNRRKEIAERILTKGYIEATPDVIKTYFDAIIFSGRDSNFYKENGLDFMNPDDVIPKFTMEDYLQRLNENRIDNHTSMRKVVEEIMNSKSCPSITEFEIVPFKLFEQYDKGERNDE